MPVSNSGQFYDFDTRPGVGVQDALTQVPYLGMGGISNPQDGTPTAAFTVANAGAGSNTPNYLWTVLAIVVLLFVFKFASEHERSGMNPQLIGINLWNLVALTTMVILGLAGAKVLTNKYLSGFPALADLINFV